VNIKRVWFRFHNIHKSNSKTKSMQHICIFDLSEFKLSSRWYFAIGNRYCTCSFIYVSEIYLMLGLFDYFFYQGGGSCTAAAFLREFTKCATWLHLDIAGVMENEGDVPYLSTGTASYILWLFWFTKLNSHYKKMLQYRYIILSRVKEKTFKIYRYRYFHFWILSLYCSSIIWKIFILLFCCILK
jgi:Cytosol aminopeptidase family, catalytic domain